MKTRGEMKKKKKGRRRRRRRRGREPIEYGIGLLPFDGLESLKSGGRRRQGKVKRPGRRLDKPC